METTRGMEKRAIWGWMLFDWASQPFYTLILTFVFAPYIATAINGGGAAGQAAWADINLVAALSVALAAPILGALTDALGRRKMWFAGLAVIYVLGVLGLWNAASDSPILPMALAYCAAFIAAELMIVVTNAMLPDLGDDKQMGRISGFGWALGYVGGIVSLFIMLAFFMPADGKETTLIGLSPVFGLGEIEGGAARASGPFAALWFLIFIIPFFLWTRDVAPVRGTIASGLSDLARSIRSLPKKPNLLNYLLASMFYRDALAGIYTFGAIYAAGVLGWTSFDLGIFGIISALIGAIGGVLGGLADERFGPRPVIRVAILLLILTSITVITTRPDQVLFMSVADGSNLPNLVFYGCGGMIGAAGAALSAASRTMLVHQAKDEIPITEAFGLYAMTGKATAFLAPLLIGFATRVTDSQPLGVAPVILLFLLGYGLLMRVGPAKITQNAARR
ncbi:MFS transporter [Paracoccaceae bacterium GXU_MW_L88]